MGAYSGNSKLYAIDLFEDQSKNLDDSGAGDRVIFFKNLTAFSIDLSRVVVDSRMSDEVRAADILGRVGRVRFFHIDGGHSYDVVANDLKLAVDVMAQEGVIAIDDVFRAEWPDVSAATFGSGILEAAEFICFAIGFNKSFFCKAPYAPIYQKALMESPFLSSYLVKTYQAKGTSVLIYQRQPLPEWRFQTFIGWVLSVYKPDLFVILRPFSARVKRFLSKLSR